MDGEGGAAAKRLQDSLRPWRMGITYWLSWVAFLAVIVGLFYLGVRLVLRTTKRR